jgi:hypothetical protein
MNLLPDIIYRHIGVQSNLGIEPGDFCVYESDIMGAGN